MATRDKHLTNDKLFLAVVNGSVEINLQVNLSMLIYCHGIRSDAKKFAKPIITTLVNARYDKVNQTVRIIIRKICRLSNFFVI